MTEALPEADLVAVRPEADDPGARLSRGALAWSLFEGVRDPYVILVTIYIFMPYVAATVVGDATKGQEVISKWSQIAGWATMATAPFLGASIDHMGRRKTWLAGCVILMAPMMCALWWTKPDHTGLSVTATLLITVIIGLLFSYTEVLHNSLLVRASGLGGAHKASSLALALANVFALFALGFAAWAFALPGKVDWSWVPTQPLFGLDPLRHEPERIVGPMAGVMLALGAVPLFLFTPDSPPSGVPLHQALGRGAISLWRMILEVRQYKDAAVFLLARMFYVDGMNSVLTYAGLYAIGVMKWGALEMLIYGIILTVLAVIGGFAARWLDGLLGSKRAVQVEIFMSLLGIVAILGTGPNQIFFTPYDAAAHAPLWHGPFFTTLPELVFILIGFSNAVFITAHYASSRTLLACLTPPDKTGAFFGAYAVAGTATAWLGPLLVNLGTRHFHSQQGGFGMISVLLAIGFVGLLFVRGDGRPQHA